MVCSNFVLTVNLFGRLEDFEETPEFAKPDEDVALKPEKFGNSIRAPAWQVDGATVFNSQQSRISSEF